MAINAGIFTFFMGNINPKTVELHKKVVEKFNGSKYSHHHIKTTLNHGASMDMAWSLNGQPVSTFGKTAIPQKFNYDVLMFLDVDCVPLKASAIDYYIRLASEGKLVGNIQRSNHIQNDQHVFAAPSAVALSVDTFEDIGRPSALPTARGDVGEEYTYKAELVGNPIHLTMPLSFEEPPAECPSWALKDGMPVYGRGTVFGETSIKGICRAMNPLFWHQFQSFHPGQQEKFWMKCEQLLV